MTHDEARKAAVEAAARALRQNNLDELGLPPETWENTGAEYREYWLKRARIAMDTAERAMADAGWRMVRDVGAFPRDGQVPRSVRDMNSARIGWNACRAAMLREGE